MGLSILALIIWGLNFGIDFTGGSLLEVKFLSARPPVNEVQEALGDLELGSLVVQPVGQANMILRFQDTSEAKHQEVSKRLNNLNTTKSDKTEEGAEEVNSEEVNNEEAEEVEEEVLSNIEELQPASVRVAIRVGLLQVVPLSKEPINFNSDRFCQ